MKEKPENQLEKKQFGEFINMFSDCNSFFIASRYFEYSGYNNYFIDFIDKNHLLKSDRSLDNMDLS